MVSKKIPVDWVIHNDISEMKTRGIIKYRLVRGDDELHAKVMPRPGGGYIAQINGRPNAIGFGKAQSTALENAKAEFDEMLGIDEYR